MSRRRGLRAFGLICLALAGAGCSDPVRRDAAAEQRLTRDARAREVRLQAEKQRTEAGDREAVRAADAEELNRHQ